MDLTELAESAKNRHVAIFVGALTVGVGLWIYSKGKSALGTSASNSASSVQSNPSSGTSTQTVLPTYAIQFSENTGSSLSLDQNSSSSSTGVTTHQNSGGGGGGLSFLGFNLFGSGNKSDNNTSQTQTQTSNSSSINGGYGGQFSTSIELQNSSPSDLASVESWLLNLAGTAAQRSQYAINQNNATAAELASSNPTSGVTTGYQLAGLGHR